MNLAYFIKPCQAKQCISKVKNALVERITRCVWTGLAVGNVFRERLPMFVIGKSQNPRYLKGVKHLRCPY